MASGGYRKPSRPAPVSGPGALSRRTDTQPKRRLPNAEYGEQTGFDAAQSGAPMQGNMIGPPSSAPSAGMGAPAQLTPFGAPSARSDEPVTAGIDMGAGPGSASLGLLDEQALQQRADTEQLIKYLPVLEFMANRPGASASLRSIVRKLKASL